MLEEQKKIVNAQKDVLQSLLDEIKNEGYETYAQISGMIHKKLEQHTLQKCEGCQGEFMPWMLAECNDKQLCYDCTYKYNADMDAMTDE